MWKHRRNGGTDYIYERRSYYFKLLNFSNDQVIPQNSRSNIESDDDKNII